MSYKIVAKGKRKDCFGQFFSGWKTGREVSKNLYPKSTSKSIPLVSRYSNEFRSLGYLEEKKIPQLVERGSQQYTRQTPKSIGNLKPYLEYAKAEKDVVFEHLERKILRKLVDNPWYLSEYISINFREYVVKTGVGVILGLRNLFKDSIIYFFFVDYAWSTLKLDSKDLGVMYPRNDFYRLGKMLEFDKILYTKVVLTAFDPPLDRMINLYPTHHIQPLKKTGFFLFPEIYEVVHKRYRKAKQDRRKELPRLYESFEEEIQRQREALRRTFKDGEKLVFRSPNSYS